MSLRTLTVKLEDRVLSEIDSEARARRVARSVVVRERLAGRRGRLGSLWDRIEDLVVDSDSAPPDLASNKARLRRYGRSRTR